MLANINDEHETFKQKLHQFVHSFSSLTLKTRQLFIILHGSQSFDWHEHKIDLYVHRLKSGIDWYLKLSIQSRERERENHVSFMTRSKSVSPNVNGNHDRSIQIALILPAEKRRRLKIIRICWHSFSVWHCDGGCCKSIYVKYQCSTLCLSFSLSLCVPTNIRLLALYCIRITNKYLCILCKTTNNSSSSNSDSEKKKRKKNCHNNNGDKTREVNCCSIQN